MRGAMIQSSRILLRTHIPSFDQGWPGSSKYVHWNPKRQNFKGGVGKEEMDDLNVSSWVIISTGRCSKHFDCQLKLADKIREKTWTLCASWLPYCPTSSLVPLFSGEIKKSPLSCSVMWFPQTWKYSLYLQGPCEQAHLLVWSLWTTLTAQAYWASLLAERGIHQR